jgi:hypothetical protein
MARKGSARKSPRPHRGTTLEELEKTTENIRIANAPTEIRTQHLRIRIGSVTVMLTRWIATLATTFQTIRRHLLEISAFAVIAISTSDPMVLGRCHTLGSCGAGSLSHPRILRCWVVVTPSDPAVLGRCHTLGFYGVG